MRRVGGPAYRIETFLTSLDSVARETKHLDPAWIVGGNDVGREFLDYARPLVGTLPRLGGLEELEGK
jgi:hypothetical protein